MAFRRLVLVAGMAAGCCPAILLADELPAFKAGLWESRMASPDGSIPATTFKQCMDGKIDIEGMMRQTGGLCSMTWKRVGDRIETESSCKMGSISSTGKGVVTGDFNSKLRIETTSVVKMDNMPAGMPKLGPTGPQSLVIEATWIGPCEAGQKPGDVIMPDGTPMQRPTLPAAPAKPR
jgi:hypothetical protein